MVDASPTLPDTQAMRLRWWSWQGLDARQAMAPAEVARRYGWLRSVGSANPYLAIHVRAGAGRAEVERAVAETELVEVPAARGCTYYVPREDAALALRLAAMGTGGAEFRMAERHLGVTDGEVRGLAEAIFRELEAGPLEPRGISKAVAPRQLGDEGKRRGMTSTLSLGLSRLQLDGRIRRLPHGGRLDTERFRYAQWEDGPRPSEMDETTAAREVAVRYFDWAGPAMAKEFREFSGLSAALAKEALVGLVPYPDDSSRWMGSEDFGVRPTQGRVVLLSSLDPWLHLRRNPPTLLDPADEARRLPFGKDLKDATSLRELDSHPIAMDGAVVGLWEFDHDAQQIVAWTWRPCREVEEAVVRTSAWIESELGDFRSFSLDSPASRRPRVELLRSLA